MIRCLACGSTTVLLESELCIFRMIYLLLLGLIAFSSASAINTTKIEPRIVGGFPATLSNVQHQVSIRKFSVDKISFGNGHLCGGSLINKNIVLTAAHCLHDANDRPLHYSYFIMAMGNLNRLKNNNNTLYIKAKKVISHPKYNAYSFDNDVGIIKLAKDVSLDHLTVKPITISKQLVTVNLKCQTTGWGSIYYQGPTSDVLLSVNITVQLKQLCNSNVSHEGGILNGMFCAGPFEGGSDSCQGDSGGPLVCDAVLRGITSHGYKCGEPNFPGVYMDVAYYYDWIVINRSTKLNNLLLLNVFSISLALKLLIII